MAESPKPGRSRRSRGGAGERRHRGQERDLRRAEAVEEQDRRPAPASMTDDAAAVGRHVAEAQALPSPLLARRGQEAHAEMQVVAHAAAARPGRRHAAAQVVGDRRHVAASALSNASGRLPPPRPASARFAATRRPTRTLVAHSSRTRRCGRGYRRRRGRSASTSVCRGVGGAATAIGDRAYPETAVGGPLPRSLPQSAIGALRAQRLRVRDMRCRRSCSPSSTSCSPRPRRPSRPGALRRDDQARPLRHPAHLGQELRRLAYGYGYAFAQDNICTIADDYVTVDARALALLRPGRHVPAARQRARTRTTSTPTSSSSRSSTRARSRTCSRKPPPDGPLPRIKQRRARLRRRLQPLPARRRRRQRASPTRRARASRGSSRSPITTPTAASTSSSSSPAGDVVIDGIGEAPAADAGAAERRARRPRAGPRAGRGRGTQRQPLKRRRLQRRRRRQGRHARPQARPAARQPALPVDRHRALLPGAAHVPGKINVAGALALRRAARPHRPHATRWRGATRSRPRTASRPTSSRSSPARRRSYLVRRQAREMTSRKVTVQVRQRDGSVKPVTRTLYSTRYGPMLQQPRRASRCRGRRPPPSRCGDANADNFRSFNHFFAIDRAQSVPQVLADPQAATRASRGSTRSRPTARATRSTPTSARSRNVTERARRSAATPALGTATFSLLGLPVLDGSRSACDWGNDPDAVEPGLFGPSHLPLLDALDYVTNSNDCYWLSNPKHPLDGFARIIGDESTARTLRTRIGLIMTQTRIDGTDGSARRASPRQTCSDMAGQRPPVRRRADRATSSSRCARASGGDRAPSSGPGRRRQRLRRARQVGPAREPRLARRAALPPLLGRTP